MDFRYFMNSINKVFHRISTKIVDLSPLRLIPWRVSTKNITNPIFLERRIP